MKTLNRGIVPESYESRHVICWEGNRDAGPAASSPEQKQNATSTWLKFRLVCKIDSRTTWNQESAKNWVISYRRGQSWAWKGVILAYVSTGQYKSELGNAFFVRSVCNSFRWALAGLGLRKPVYMNNITPLYYLQAIGKQAVLPWPDISDRAKWSVSSFKFGFGAECLRDGDPDTFWQWVVCNCLVNCSNSLASSDGPQPHFITVEFPRKLAIQVSSTHLNIRED